MYLQGKVIYREYLSMPCFVVLYRLYKEFYFQIFKCVSFWLHCFCCEWEGWARKPLKHTRWVAVVTPTDRPKSVHNRCVIEYFVVFLCCHFAGLTFLFV